MNLCTVRGIPVRVHATFFLLLIWVAMQAEGSDRLAAFKEALFVLALFACVLLHELGHALTAKRYGIKTRDIMLYPFGGVASIVGEPGPRAELVITAAGPLVNIAIAALLYLTHLVVPLHPFFQQLLFANIVLAVFNLIPAYPMDGGRIFRAALLIFKVKSATVIAAKLSQVLSVVLGLTGLYFGNALLVIVAILVFSNAMQEHVRSQARSVAHNHSVKDVMTDASHVETFSHGVTVSQALRTALRSFQTVFPVVHAGQVLGLVDRAQLIQLGASDGTEDYISSVMARDFKIVSPHDSVESLMRSIDERDINAFLVVDEGRLVGLVLKDQLIEYLLVNELRKQRMEEADQNRENGDPLS